MSRSTQYADQLKAFSDHLVEVHDYLRAELQQVRAGAVPSDPSRQLALHCLSFCATLTAHHSHEDAGMFPAMIADAPELAPMVAKLAQDHEMVAKLIEQLRTLSRALAAPGTADVDRVRGEIEGLAAILDSHFAFEERQVRSWAAAVAQRD